LVRLFRQDKLSFSPTKQHASVPTKNTGKLPSDMVHHAYNTIGELFAKPARNYSTRSAKIMYINGKRANVFSPFFHGLGAFVGSYFFRGGIFGGTDGFTISLSNACNTYLKYAKLLEYQRDPVVREKEDFDKVW
jgi:hypothetical protein